MSRNINAVCLVGAGYISSIHAEALTNIPGVFVNAIVDPNREAAVALADKWGAKHIFTSAEEAIASGQVGRAHILTPPQMHKPLAEQFIAAKIPTLIEKPAGVSADECRSLLSTVESSGTPAGVNQNFVYHPAMVKMQDLLRHAKLGRLQYVHCVYNAPLRQLAAGQFSHWMFQQPGNILLEQAVHPLSQIAAIAGDILNFSAIAGKPVDIAPGMPFYDSAQINLQCALAPAQLSFAVGKNFPFWQITAVCDDGVIIGDFMQNKIYTHKRTRWLDPADHAISGLRTAAEIAMQSVQGIANYALATAKLKPRSDSFYKSMEASIRAFHDAVDSGKPVRCDVAFGARLVEICEEIATQIFVKSSAHPIKTVQSATGCDVSVLGGTGFIGRYVVQKLVADGKRVAVMARSTTNLPEIYHHAHISLIRGDVCKADDVARGIGDAPVVINLAHGGGGADWPAIEAALVGSARAVAQACLAAGVKRLLHIGSIAGLYLGDGAETITGATPPDQQADNRGDYARAKALADNMLLQMFRDKKLPVVILRPGIVVGKGSSPFHSGLGFFNNDQHCLGWNNGNNPLPFVLVQDVADAIISACEAEGIEGKCYNLVGGAQMSARNYVAALGAAMQRPLYFHGQSAVKLQAVEIGKWLVKRAAGRDAGFPSYRDLLSRGMMAQFDCSDARRDLNWHPVDDKQHFVARAITIFTPATM